MGTKISMDVRQEGDTVTVEWPFYVGNKVIWTTLGQIAFVVFFLWVGGYQYFVKSNLLWGGIFAACGAFFLLSTLCIVFGKGFGRALRGTALTQLVFHRDGKIELPWASMRGTKKSDLVSDRSWQEIVAVEWSPASQWGWRSSDGGKTEPMQVYFTYQDGGRDVVLQTLDNMPTEAIARDYAAQVVAGIKQGLSAIGGLAAQVDVLDRLVREDLGKMDENPRRRL